MFSDDDVLIILSKVKHMELLATCDTHTSFQRQGEKRESY